MKHLMIVPYYKFEILYDTSEGRYPYLIPHLGSACEVTALGCLYKDSDAVVELKKYISNFEGSVYIDFDNMNTGMSGYFCSVEVDSKKWTYEEAQKIAENVANIAEKYAKDC